MSQPFPNIRYAVRTLRKSAAVTGIAIVSLALGIGSNVAIFSVINALILRPLPVHDPWQLVGIRIVGQDGKPWSDTLSLPMFEMLNKNQRVFSSMFAWSSGAMANFEANGLNYAATLSAVSGDYFATLGVQPLLGRSIGPTDVNLESGRAAPVAVLDYRCWRQRFNGDPAVIHKTIRINRRLFTIVGVMPKDYVGWVIDAASEVTVPIGDASTQTLRDRDDRWLVVVGRLKHGLSLEQARANVRVLWPSVIRATVPDRIVGQERVRFFGRRIDLQSAATGTSWMRERLSRPLLVLMGLVGAVLLITCVNLANLMVARAAGRQHEIGVRLALGAGTWRLIQQLLAESLVLSITGAAAGLLIAYWTTSLLVRFVWTGFAFAPLGLDPTPDLRVLTFTAVVTLLTSVLFGLAPSWHISRFTSVGNLLMQNPRTVHGRAGVFGKLLVGAQVALSLVLVVAAALLARSLGGIRSVDPGFRREGVLVMQLYLKASQERIPDRSVYYRDLAERLARLPGVESVSYSHMAPVFAREYKQTVSTPASAVTTKAVVDVVGPNFFNVMGMRLLAGREFEWRDDEKAPRVLIVSESLARRLFHDESPIGRRVDIAGGHEYKGLRIVGVVNSASLWMVQSREPEAAYLSMMQEPGYNQSMVDIRTSVDPRAITQSASRALESMGHHFALRTQTLEERVDAVLTTERMTSMLATFFGVLALLLASIGLYGVLSYSLIRRTSEIAIRMALGARRADVVALMVWEVMVPVVGGVSVGVFGALATSRMMTSLLFELSGSDPATLALSVVVMLGTAALAGYLPAHRASRVDPMTALRQE